MSSSRGRIPQDVLDDIASRLDIVDLVGRYVPLTRRGANYMGLCPFHAEKTPSFSVSPEKQIFHCFGCGAGGNLYRFLMDIEGLTFPEAARRLAQEAGVTLPETQLSPEAARAQALRKRYYRVMELAQKYYAHQWQEADSQIYKAYATARGLSPEVIEAYGIGATSPGWDGLVQFLGRCKVPFQDMEVLGLGQRSRQGKRVFDRFRDRLMFPIRDASGRTIGFGGRLVGESDQPQKYLNSPETPLFHKSDVLFGLDLAQQAIRQRKSVVITEGYMDVVTCHQAGIDEVVAPMGTTLTQQQVKALMRYTYDFILAFDGDQAGQRAALKALDLIDDLGGRAQVLVLADDADPDTFIQTHGGAAFREALAGAVDGIDFRLKMALQDRNLETVTDKMAVLDDLMDHLVAIRQRARLEMTVAKVAEALNLSQQAVQDEIHYQRRRQPSPKPGREISSESSQVTTQMPALSPQEEKEGLVLSLLFAFPEYFTQVEEAGGLHLFSDKFSNIYQAALDSYQKEGQWTAASIPAEWSHMVSRLPALSDQAQSDMRPDYFERLLQQVAWQSVHRRYQALVQALEQRDLDDDQADRIMEEAGRLLEEKTRLERVMRKEQ